MSEEIHGSDLTHFEDRTGWRTLPVSSPILPDTPAREGRKWWTRRFQLYRRPLRGRSNRSGLSCTAVYQAVPDKVRANGQHPGAALERLNCQEKPHSVILTYEEALLTVPQVAGERAAKQALEGLWVSSGLPVEAREAWCSPCPLREGRYGLQRVGSLPELLRSGVVGKTVKEEKLSLLCERLVAEGFERLRQPRGFVHFTGVTEADELLNNLDEYPHAFVIACIMDRQMKAEKAWCIPLYLKQRIGNFDFPSLARLSQAEVERLMREPTSLHRFPEMMAANLHSAIRLIEARYGGDASMIWAGRPSSAAIVRRFLEFRGVGQKIATMAANVLVRDFRVPVSDRYSIDISVDIQVRRVFSRMGFVDEGASAEFIIYRARELHPEYPGIFDLVLWELGRTVCLPKQPSCDRCRWSALCAYAERDG